MYKRQVHGRFPDRFMGLVVSGGHSSLLLVDDMTDEAKKTNPPEGADAPADRAEPGSRPDASVPEPGVETPKGDLPSPEEEKENGPEIPEVLPLLPVRDIVIFPYMTLPLFVGREGSVAAVDEALARDRYIFLATQRDPSVEDPKEGDLYRTGTVAMIMRMLKLPDGRLKILIQGVVKAKIVEFIEAKPAVRVRIDRIVESPMKDCLLYTSDAADE